MEIGPIRNQNLMPPSSSRPFFSFFNFKQNYNYYFPAKTDTQTNSEMKPIKRVVPVEASSTGFSVVRSASPEARLSLYLVPPIGEITVEELELYAIDRLKGSSISSCAPDFSHISLVCLFVYISPEGDR